MGKTRPGIIDAKSGQKHPHVRGEDSNARIAKSADLETPPRAWGRHQREVLAPFPLRNTPTCVGKTVIYEKDPVIPEKHPHVRGEDNVASHFDKLFSETPPRAWGRQTEFIMQVTEAGNTPTCVGKT